MRPKSVSPVVLFDQTEPLLVRPKGLTCLLFTLFTSNQKKYIHLKHLPNQNSNRHTHLWTSKHFWARSSGILKKSPFSDQFQQSRKSFKCLTVFSLSPLSENTLRKTIERGVCQRHLQTFIYIRVNSIVLKIRKWL